MPLFRTFRSRSLLTLAAIAATVIGSAASFDHASASRDGRDAAHDAQSVTNGGDPATAQTFLVSGGCQVEIDGRRVDLRVGEGIRTAGGWRNCESYDGHRLIVYSGSPPAAAAQGKNDR